MEHDPMQPLSASQREALREAVETYEQAVPEHNEVRAYVTGRGISGETADTFRPGGDDKAVRRFWRKVELTDTCWNWTGCLDNGYGRFWLAGRRSNPWAHRLAWERLVGEIPDDKVLDHLCRNRACVNPSHLELVSNSENVRRGEVGLSNARRGEAMVTCRRAGHPLRVQQGGKKDCPTCRKERRDATRTDAAAEPVPA